jgi:TfoX/Sxy family transcriptional regulator of competence genes
MPYSEALAERIRDALTGLDVREQKMFGGIAWMVNTHMAAGIVGDDLLARVGRDGHEAALSRGATEMDMGGRFMRGFVRVPAEQLDDDGLREWLDVGVEFAQSQPPKK